jgi:23S rRNA pseudouridine955/2504/2580 synthase
VVVKKINFKSLIIHEDDSVIIINKPAFLVSTVTSFDLSLTVEALAKAYNPNAILCHRLDKNTSGAMIIAKGEANYRLISIQFERREIEKTYHAIIEGCFLIENREVSLPIAKVGNNKASIDFVNGKAAKTIFNTLKIFKNYTLIEAKPVTGRFHQIRVHSAHKGTPLIGDAMYGGNPFLLSKIKRKYKQSSKVEEEQSLFRRQALHSYSIKFIHPETQEALKIVAPYPKDFMNVVRLLEKYNAQ